MSKNRAIMKHNNYWTINHKQLLVYGFTGANTFSTWSVFESWKNVHILNRKFIYVILVKIHKLSEMN